MIVERHGYFMIQEDSIKTVKGIGDKTEKSFHKLNIFTVGDLLEHYPRGYEVFEQPAPICTIAEGNTVSIEASVCGTPELKRVRNLQIINCRVKDSSGSLLITWFNMPFLKNTLRLGYKFIFRGKVVRKAGYLTMEQPKIISREEYVKSLKVMQPIYPLTEGITNHMISKTAKIVLEQLTWETDYLPKRILKEYDLISRKAALMEIHFPKGKETVMEARKRLIFDEFFLFTLALRSLKENKTVWVNDFVFQEREECEQLIGNLPYQLTKAQLRVFSEIKKDMTGNTVMNRLVQGDVGSGKTIIAGLSLLMAAKNGYQGCLMVPTEVLAKQHYEELTKLFEPFDVKVDLLVGSMTASKKREAYERIKNHEVDVVVGTHALIQEKVEYDKLALVITDEQHRFGVRQRETLSEKGMHPHVLVMSATPIPRTLAIILYGDLDISVIDELPARRLPIKNCVVDTNYRPTAYRFIEKEILNGRQAYVICPMVEESESIEAENVIEYTEKLKEALPMSVVVEYLHGKMKAKEKNDIMERFASGEIKVLVSTTVVEVGVNVPNASVIMIENAERFGLAQLHQLRGRVGRGIHQSYCILVNGLPGRETKERLEILNKSNDGFFIASEDLKLRGPGDMFGIRQSGVMEFKIGDIYTDATILSYANEAVKNMLPQEIKDIYAKAPWIKHKVETYNASTI